MNKQKKILILGASSDIGLEILDMLDHNHIIGAHCFKGEKRIVEWKRNKLNNVKIFKKNLIDQKSSHKLVEDFIKWSGGIDILIQLNGNISSVVNWQKLSEKNFYKDFAINFGAPFFISQKIFHYMKKKGGKIIFMSTASAKHGGGNMTMGYGLAKSALETLTKGLARDGAKYKILVNAIAPGFIDTRFHKDKLKRNLSDIKKRVALSKLKKIGKPIEIAKIVEYLISDQVNYITGEVISISGGDWL